MSGLPEQPKVKDRQVVYSGYYDVRIDDLESPQGSRMSYTCLDIKAHATAVLARTKTKELIVTREYRHPTGKWLLSCPGGRIDANESPEQAARRELQEETGYTGGDILPIGAVFPLPAVTDQIIHYIFIDGVSLTHPLAHEPFELIQIQSKKPDALLSEIESGTPLDGVLCTALFLGKKLWMP